MTGPGVSWFIARRFFMTARRSALLSFISTIAIAGVCLGTAALIIALSILDGFEREIKEKVISFTSHIHVTGYGNKPLDDPGRSVGLIGAVPGIRSVMPYAAREGMIRSRQGVEGVYLKGIDTTRDDGRLRAQVTGGGYFSGAAGPVAQVVIGKSLAWKLGVSPGDTVFVFALAGEGAAGLSPRGKKFVVAGTFESGMTEYDEVFAATTLDAAGDLFRLSGRVTGFDVMVDDLARIDTIAAGIESALGYPHAARSVFSVYRNLFSWAELQKQLSPILLSLIVIVATVNIVGTVLMFVLEKSREIGVLKSMGAGVAMIRKIFLYQGVLIGAAGVLLGNLVALVLLWIQAEYAPLSLPADIYYMNTVPVMFDPWNFVIVSALTLLLSYLTTIIPAHAAGRTDPVKIFRFG
ncbi:MAG TPA: ABC transporter permease [Bacteroidota bacterium]|nr:ABC transporter permease [Bacteroidota bacterium]